MGGDELARGLNIPKGKKITDKGVRPDFLTKKQAEEFQRIKRNYNERIRRQEKKYADMYGVDREKIRRTGLSGVPVFKRLTDIKSKTEYQAIMRMMKHSTTKTYKAQRDKEMRETLFDIIDTGYRPCPKRRRWLKNVISKMTPEQIVDFRMKNRKIVRDFFEAYKREMGADDADSFESDIVDIGRALEPYAKKPMPGC